MNSPGTPRGIPLPNRLDFDAMREIESSLADRIKGPSPSIVADATHTEYMDSMAVGILVRILKDVQHAGGTFTIRNLQGDPHVLFEETGLNKLFALENADHADNESGITVKMQSKGGVQILKVSGPVSYPRAALFLKEQILLALAEKQDILIDLLEVEYVDSSSIGEILQLHGMMGKTGAKMAVCGLTGIVHEAFESLSIDRLIPCYENVESALEAIANRP